MPVGMEGSGDARSGKDKWDDGGVKRERERVRVTGE